MKKFMIAAAAAAALIGGSFAVNSASASTTKVSAVSATSATTLTRGWCVKSGTGELRNLWLTGANSTCPDPYWGPTSLGAGSPGPQGPKGDKGDPGTNDLVIKHATAVFTPTSPATASLTVTGLPAYSATSGQIYGTNADALPAGVTLVVATATPALGSTTRVFNVTGISVAVGKTFTLDVWAAAVATA